MNLHGFIVIIVIIVCIVIITQSVDYIGFHSWCCTSYGFGQMCSDMYPSLWCPAEYFHGPKNPVCSLPVHLYVPLTPPHPLATTSLLLSHNFAFSRISYHQNHTVCSPSDWLLSLRNMHLRLLQVSMSLHGSFHSTE